MTTIGTIARTAHTELLQLIAEDDLAAATGAPIRKTRGSKAYWYASRRVGTTMQFDYLGEDTDATRARVDHLKKLRKKTKDRQAQRSRLVRLLRAEGLAPTGQATGAILSAMAATGLFRQGGVMVGAHAYPLYEGELGRALRPASIADQRLSPAEPLRIALPDPRDPAVGPAFSSLRFEPAPGGDKGRIWRWAQGGSGQLVEFLTPTSGEETIRFLPALGVSVGARHDLSFLIADPIAAPALYRSGVLVQVPRPERFAIHKLIVANRHRHAQVSPDSARDRDEAAVLIEALNEDRPDDLARAYASVMALGPRWTQDMDDTLTRMPRTKAILDSLGI